MNSITTAIEQLRAAADELEGVTKRLAMPVQEGIDIPGAFARLTAATDKDTHLSINVEFDNLNARNGKPYIVKWEVYDGSARAGHSHFSGATLADAVNACLASHQPPKEGDAANDMICVEQTLAEPLPM